MNGCSEKTGEKDDINKKYASLWEYIESLPVIDTHEHFSSEAELKGAKIDFFHLLTPYVVDNLETAGCSSEEILMLNNPALGINERWQIFNRYYPLIKNTTYMLALQRSLHFEYQMKEISLKEVKRVSDALAGDFEQDGFMKYHMEKLNIESMLTFRSPSLKEMRRSYGDDNIRSVPTVNEISVLDAESLGKIEQITEMPIKNLDDILTGIDKLFFEFDKNGIDNIKIGSAYNRELNFKQRTRKEAEDSFNKIINTAYDYSDKLPGKYYVYNLLEYHIPLDDYLTVYMIEQAQKYEMNVIFHLGLAAWNFNSSTRSHASSLEWLIKTYQNVNFVLLHAGYPFFEEAILYAKYYPNVYLNMTWDHIIEREKSIRAVISFIEMLPTNKIHAFGGDYIYPQQLYGNLIYTKENIFMAFSRLIDKGALSEEDAREIAYAWFYKNPKDFYYKN